MTSWYSNILTKTSSQISSLRSTLLSGEADGDTEDDTHVCRVLRNYYGDKGRPLPTWLPPDPKAPAPIPQPLYAQSQVGSRYGGMGGPQQQPQPGGGLSSLWDSAPAGAQQPMQPQSLRAGRAPPAAMQRGREDVQARPLPSQRAGSHQVPSPVGQGLPPPAAAGGGSTAQDRLRQRLRGGGRTGSPGAVGQGPSQVPSGGSNYEDRFAPGGGQYESGAGQAFMGANAPWAGGGDEYGGGGGGGRSAGPNRRQGLPNGPRGYR